MKIFTQDNIINSSVALLSLLAVTFLWRSPLLLAALLVMLGGVHLSFVKNSAWKVYVFGIFFGGLSESFAILVGGAWTYQLPDFMGIPMWLPLLWGVAALFITQVAKFFRG